LLRIDDGSKTFKVTPAKALRVPQGSHLPPILFSCIGIDGIALSYFKVIMFADELKTTSRFCSYRQSDFFFH